MDLVMSVIIGGAGVAMATGNTKSVEKEIEKAIVKACAGGKKSDRKALVSDYDVKISTVAQQTKDSLNTIKGDMDETMKGEFSKSVQQTMNDNASKYDDLLYEKSYS